MSAADEADDLLENESATTEGPGPSSLGTTPAPGLGRGAAAPLRQSPAPSLPQRAPDSFDEWYASLGVTPAQRHEQQVRLKAALESAAEMTPERARRIMFMRTQTGLPPEYINSNLEDVERAHRIAGGHFDLAKFQERNPGLAAWIAAHPESGALAKDEIAEWSALEWVLGRWHFDPRGALDFFTVADGHAPFPHERGVVEKIVRGEGSDQVESADLGFKRLMGSATPADLERLKQLDAKTPVDWGDRNWFSHGVVVQSRMLPYEWGAIKAGGAGAGIGAAGGALVAGIPAAFAGPEAIGPAALGGARVGAKWGGGIGSALYTAKQEAGGAFNEYMEMPGMDENAARVAALLVGAVNGGLEVYGEKVVLETAVPGLKRAVSRFLGRDAVKTALAVPTVRAALSALGKKLLRSHGTEITTEVLQEAATIVGGWASAKASGIENPLFTSEHGQRLWDTAVQTAQAMTIAATPGPLFEMGGDLVNIRRARLNQARLAEAVAKVNGRKLTAEDPHTTSELIQSIAEAQDQPHVYVKKEAIRKFFQDAGVEDVDAAMARTLPDGGRAFLDAPENGDVAIPAGEFLARWAPSGAYPALAADMRLSPSDMTPREAEEAEAQRDKLIEELVERGKRLPPAPDDVAVFEDVSRKLRDTGRFSDEAADTNARLWQAFFRAMAARWNEGRPEGDASRVTARELYGQFEVAVESEGRAGLRPLGRAAVAPAAPSAAVVPAGTEASVPPEAGALNARFAAVDDAGRLASTKKWEHGVEPGEAERAAIEERDAVLAALRDVAPELVQHLSPELQAHWSAAMESERYGADDAERLARVIERYVAAGDFEDARRALARLRDAGDDVEAAELPDEVRAGHAAANAVIGPLRARLAARIEAAEAEARSAGEGHDAAESAGTPVLRRKPSDVSPAATWAFSVVEPSRKYALEHRIVPLDSLVTSHDAAGNPDPEYPYKDLQERNRGSVASKQQVASIAGSASFENLLTEQHAIDRGTPIVGGDDLAVESGNGRVTALRKARDAGRENWAGYQDELRRRAAELGLSTDGIVDPVLVRVRSGADADMTHEDRVRFTRDANGQGILGKSPEEWARVDAERITPQMLRDLPVAGENGLDDILVSAEGAKWIRGFLAVVPDEEHTRFIADDGKIAAQGIEAIRLALFRRVFGGEYADRITRRLTEVVGESKANLNRAIFYALPRFVKLVAKIEDGEIDSSFDPRPGVVAAVDFYSRVKAQGKNPEEMAEHENLFGHELGADSRAIVSTIAGAVGSPARLAGYLNGYANAVLQMPPESQGSLFGDAPATMAELWRANAERVDDEQDAAVARRRAAEDASIARRIQKRDAGGQAQLGVAGEPGPERRAAQPIRYQSADDAADNGDAREAAVSAVPTMDESRRRLFAAVSPSLAEDQRRAVPDAPSHDDPTLERLVQTCLATDEDPASYYQPKPDDPVDQRSGYERDAEAWGEGTDIDSSTKSIPPSGDDGATRTLFDSEEQPPLPGVEPATAKRGYIELPGAGGRSYRIALLERANLSTFLHESGHFFLEVLGDLGARENAPAALKADLARACEWLGAETVAGLTEDQHERFARAFEAYLREGSAPSVELVGIFQRFSAWLLEVYRSLRGLRVELDDEIRATFDRLLASDDELKNAELLNVVQNIFPNAEAAGMSPAEYQDYVDAVTRAHGEAERELLSTLIDEQARERSRAYLAEKDKLTDQMTDAVDRDPAVRIRTLLETGRLPETEETPDELRDVKLDRGAVEEVVGPQATRRMRNLTEDPTGRLFDGGPRIVHPDDLAGLFGYESGAAMLEALAATKRRDAEIAARVDARMKELFPPAAESGELAEKALKAVHGDARGRVLQHELRALARRVGGGASPMEMVREAARRIVGETPVREIHHEIYRRGEAKAARAALDAAARGDWAAAFKAKQEQILNWNLYREAKDARDGADAIARHMARLSGSAAQSRIGKAGGTYLEQINAFLDRFEFRRITDTRLERRLSLRQWIDEQRAADSEVAIPEYLVDEAFRKNYRELTWEQLRDVKESVANIEHLARLKRTLLIAGKAREWAAAKASLLRRLRQSYPDRAPIPLDRRTKEGIQAVAETAKAALKRMDASLLKVEQLVMWLDGGDGEGPWHELVWNPIADAEHEENRLNEAATLRLLQLFEELPKEQRERLYHKQVFIPSLGQPMTYQAMIAVALNYGNESNYDKLVRGAPMDVKAWGPEVVEDILAHLSKEDWDFVQGVWDLLDAELWPKVADLEKRQTGTTPPKIQGRKFQRRFSDGSIREYRGGYYPVIYNPEQDFYGRLQADEHSTTSTLFDHGYVKAATPHGYTNARTKYAGPILLSLDVLPRHIAQVCHDVAHREAIQQAYRVVTDPEIRAELVKALGRPYADALVDWVKYVANSQAMAMTDAARFWSGTVLGNLRRNAAIVAMGFKATTTIAQLAGYSMSLDLVKGKYLRLGLQEFLRNPKAAVEWIESISGEMKERWKNLDRDANDRIRELTKRATPLSKMQRVAMHGIGYFDLAVSGPTWIAGYRQGLAEGLDEDAAVRQADRAVMLSQGGGAAKDLSAIQQAGGALRLLTMFYTFFNVLYARGRDMGHVVSEEWGRGQHGRAFVDLFTRSWFLFIVPALLSEILAHRGPDDDEGWGEWAMRKALVYPFLTIPVLRDVATSIAERHVSYRFSPVASALEKLVSAGRGVLDGDVGKVGRSSVDLAGYGLGLPTGQARISATYLWDLASGEEHPDSAWDVVRDVMFSRPPHKDAKKRREGGR